MINVGGIEANFPFDLYLLKHSSEYIRDYLEWEDDDDSSEESDISEVYETDMSFTPDCSFDFDWGHSPLCSQ